jgi:hypothetical protein
VVPHAHLTHLVRRFAGSLRPGGPSAADEAWAVAWLGDGERALWRRMGGPDRRHAVGVARRVVATLDVPPERPVVAAALLHDVGKVDAGLGTFGRVVATVAAAVAGRRRGGTRRWPASGGRLARYLRHDAIGATLLHQAGADPLTVAWAREHHLPPDRWTVPAAVAQVLKAADDD